MILVDDRQGSGEFAKLFGAYSIEVVLERMEFGDFAFCGNSVDAKGNPTEVPIGVERKALGDFLQVMNDNRFVGHQLPGMLDTYHYSVLVVEGTYRPDEEGYLEELVPIWDRANNRKSDSIFKWKRVFLGKKVVLFSAVANHLNTLRLKAGRPNAGFLVMQTSSKLSTTFEVAALYKWWSRPWKDHSSHLGFYDPASTLRLKSSLLRKCAMQLDGIGEERSALVEKQFKTLHAMVNSSQIDWEKIDGIGKKSAVRIINQIRGEKNGNYKQS